MAFDCVDGLHSFYLIIGEWTLGTFPPFGTVSSPAGNMAYIFLFTSWLWLIQVNTWPVLGLLEVSVFCLQDHLSPVCP